MWLARPGHERAAGGERSDGLANGWQMVDERLAKGWLALPGPAGVCERGADRKLQRSAEAAVCGSLLADATTKLLPPSSLLACLLPLRRPPAASCFFLLLTRFCWLLLATLLRGGPVTCVLLFAVRPWLAASGRDSPTHRVSGPGQFWPKVRSGKPSVRLETRLTVGQKQHRLLLLLNVPLVSYMIFAAPDDRPRNRDRDGAGSGQVSLGMHPPKATHTTIFLPTPA